MGAGSEAQSAARSRSTCSRPIPATRQFSIPVQSSGSFAAAVAAGTTRLLVSILMLEVWLRDYLPRATGDGTPSARADQGPGLMCGICGVVQVGGEARAVLAPVCWTG